MRIAIACQHDGCMWRSFDNPDARCPEHPRESYVQRNRPYHGRELAQPDIGLPVIDPMEVAKPKRGRR